MIKPAKMKRMELISKEVSVASTYIVAHAYSWNLENNFCISWKHFYHLIGMTANFFCIILASLCQCFLYPFITPKMENCTIKINLLFPAPLTAFSFILIPENVRRKQRKWHFWDHKLKKLSGGVYLHSSFGSITFLRVHKPSKSRVQRKSFLQLAIRASWS